MPGGLGLASEFVPSSLHPGRIYLFAPAPGGQSKMLVPPTVSRAALSCCFTWIHFEKLGMVIIMTIPFQNPRKGP